MASSKPPFPFLRLPVEIRRMVYILQVKQKFPVIQFEPKGSGKHSNGPIDPSSVKRIYAELMKGFYKEEMIDLRFAFSSKLLFAEVMKTFLEENTIELELNSNYTDMLGLPILFNPEVLSAAYWSLESIKRINVFIRYDQTKRSDFMIGEVKKLCNVIQRCSLARLEITACCQERLFDETLNESFDHILAGLEVIRDVRELVFTENLATYRRWNRIYEPLRVLGTEKCKKRLQDTVTKPRKDTTD